MSPYTAKYNESEYQIQNINLLYQIHQQCQKTFEKTSIFQKVQKQIEHFQTIHFLFCYMYKFHNSYFVVFVYLFVFIYFVFLYYIYIYIIYTRTVVLSYCRSVVFDVLLMEASSSCILFSYFERSPPADCTP